MKDLNVKRIKSKRKARGCHLYPSSKSEIEKVIMSPLAEDLEGCTKSTRSVHIDDDLIIWNEIKDLQASYYLPTLCGGREMFTFIFVEEQKANES